MNIHDLWSPKQWDWEAIFYNLVAAGMVTAFAMWIGVFRYARNLQRKYLGIRAYRKKLRDSCSQLTVIGKKQGFSLPDVFVQLDIATSSLSPTPDEKHNPGESFVLLGGPGAGKSTMVRQMILACLDCHRPETPFFLRLRDYAGEEPIEDCLMRVISAHGIPDPGGFVQERLAAERCFCVLDGLDEVRPHLLPKVCDQINKFYHTRFDAHSRGQLVVTCRKEAYRSRPLDIPQVSEVRPLSDPQINRFANSWPLKFPEGKSPDTFSRELHSAPRILELARSPLLLVGGLMQYTESNVGIPEERVQYLDRIARWLLSDWATAQGHPVDSFKSAHDKLLTKLAFYMHRNEVNECPTTKVLELFRSWLPMFGFAAKDAEAVLENISTKTGILVRDLPGCAVFAQFGLQEVFASKAAVKELGPNGIAEASMKSWWREAVLLSTAQEQDPSPVLRALFKANPLMGAACVAECATPSLEMQQKAVEICISAIDANDSGAQAPAVALLRKLNEGLALSFCQELEHRLTRDASVQRRVGIILATADTPSTSKTLLRYPHLWNTCLEGVGYVSNTFENLLVEWISKGTQDEAFRAIDVVCRSLSRDRRDELLRLLPALEHPRSERLAANLLRHFEQSDANMYNWGEHFLKRITSCVSHIRNPATYLEARGQTKPESERHSSNPIPTVLLMASSDPSGVSTLWMKLRNGLLWSRQKGALRVWMGACLLSTCLLTILQLGGSWLWPWVLISGSLLIAAGFAAPFAPPPWDGRLIGPRASGFAGVAFILGGMIAFISAPEHIFYPSEIKPHRFLIVLGICGLVGTTISLQTPYGSCHSKYWNSLQWVCHLFGPFAFLQALAYAQWPTMPHWCMAPASAAYLLFFFLLSRTLHADWLEVRTASAQLEKEESEPAR